MVLATEKITNVLTTVYANDVKVVFNIRHGWESEKILEGYRKHIDELKESILQEGYKVSEPIEVYIDEENNLCLKEGHHRLQASKEILENDPDHIFAEGLDSGEIYAVISSQPKSNLDLLRSQINSNRSAGNTPLDLAKAANLLMKEPIVGEDGKELKKSAKEDFIGGMLGATRQSVIKYIKLSELAESIKDWIQESLLSSDDENNDLTLSWTNAVKIVDIVKTIPKANKVLLRAKEICENTPDEVETHGNAVRLSWLEKLAKQMFPETKPEAKTASKTASNASDQIEDTEDSTKETDTTEGNIQTSGNTNNGTGTNATSKFTSEGKLRQQLNVLIDRNAGYFLDYKPVESEGKTKFIFELPEDIGSELIELIAALQGGSPIAEKAEEETEETDPGVEF